MSEYRGFKVRDTGRSYIGERPLPEHRAIYRLVGGTLRELERKIDDWLFHEAIEGSFLGSPSTGEPACPRYPNPATLFI